MTRPPTKPLRPFLETMHIRATWARRPSPEQSQRLEALWDRATEDGRG